MPTTGDSGWSRIIRAVVSTSSPSVFNHDCSGTPVRVERLSSGWLTCHQLRPSWSCNLSTASTRPPVAASTVVPSNRAAWSLIRVIEGSAPPTPSAAPTIPSGYRSARDRSREGFESMRDTGTP